MRSGYTGTDYGVIRYAGSHGYYWLSQSHAANTNAYDFSFGSTVKLSEHLNRRYAFSVLAQLVMALQVQVDFASVNSFILEVY